MKSLLSGKARIKREAGFSLVELMITMIIFVLVIAATSRIFTGLLTQYKQQSKIAETGIEGIVGLEILRRDLEHAGYGLPWTLPVAWAASPCNAPTGYVEAGIEGKTPWVDRDLNDGPPNNPARGSDSAGACNVPAALRSLNGDPAALNRSDILAIKAVNVAMSAASQKSTILRAEPFTATFNPREWSIAAENLLNTDRVIVIRPGINASNFRELVVNGGAFFTTRDVIDDAGNPWAPPDATESRFVYGIDPITNLRMPFNRADYYIGVPASIPSRCAAGTGILYKSPVSQIDGLLPEEYPLFDCVADFQVDFWLDTDGDGNINWPPVDSIANLTAQEIRNRLKEVRAYIVAHEGQRDPQYDFSRGNTRELLSVTEELGASSRTINFANLKTAVGDPEYKFYRWKLYTVVAKPNFTR